jgi:hypothetical protein
MPLKLNVGLMKKIGQPHYGSLSASCHVELELESLLLGNDIGAFQARVEQAFAACRGAVEKELALGDQRRMSRPAATTEPADQLAESSSSASGATNNGAAQDRGLSKSVLRKGATGRDGGPPAGAAEFLPASASQLDYIRRLASRIGRAAALRVEVLAQRCFSKPLHELSREEATRLILTLRAVKAGELDWETVLEQSAAWAIERRHAGHAELGRQGKRTAQPKVLNSTVVYRFGAVGRPSASRPLTARAVPEQADVWIRILCCWLGLG